MGNGHDHLTNRETQQQQQQTDCLPPNHIFILITPSPIPNTIYIDFIGR